MLEVIETVFIEQVPTLEEVNFLTRGAKPEQLGLESIMPLSGP